MTIQGLLRRVASWRGARREGVRISTASQAPPPPAPAPAARRLTPDEIHGLGQRFGAALALDILTGRITEDEVSAKEADEIAAKLQAQADEIAGLRAFQAAEGVGDEQFRNYLPAAKAAAPRPAGPRALARPVPRRRA